MELAVDLEALMRSVGDGNWQGLSSQPYAKPVHFVLEALFIVSGVSVQELAIAAEKL